VRDGIESNIRAPSTKIVTTGTMASLDELGRASFGTRTSITASVFDGAKSTAIIKRITEAIVTVNIVMS